MKGVVYVLKIPSFFKVAALTAGIIFSSTSSVAADALDNFRAILLSGTFTLKYENVTPPSREAMHEKFQIYGGNVEPPENPYTMYKPITGLVTASGDNRYVETNSYLSLPNVAVRKVSFLDSVVDNLTGKNSAVEKTDSEYATCVLTKNDEKFIYTRITLDEKIQYIGKKKGTVEAVKIKKGFREDAVQEFGDGEMTRILNALLPDDKKVADTITYKRSGSGTLSNGLYYVDLHAEKLPKDTIFDAIRFYFENGTLVKIEAGQYYKTKTGKLDGTRTIINVTEFSDAAETKYFKLPTGLKDVTKRESKGGVKK